MVSENDAAESRASELTRALMHLHPDHVRRDELEAAGVNLPRINALYPLDIDFFITCLSAYLDSGAAFCLLWGDSEKRADRLDFAAWATFDEVDREGALKRWGNAADKELEVGLIKRLEANYPYHHQLSEKKYFAASVNTTRLLSRLFWYQMNLHLSTNPYRAHSALVNIYAMAMPDLLAQGAAFELATASEIH